MSHALRPAALVAALVLLAGCGSAGGVRPDVPYAFPFETRFAESVPAERIHLVELGPTGPVPPDGPTVAFVHGIPTSLYLWRNVLPTVAADARVVAFDLPGYGESDLPADGDVGYGALARRTDAVLDRLAAESADGLVLVVNDLGSVLALDWAARHPEAVAGIVLAEAVFMPARDWYEQLTLMQHGMFWMFGSGALARQMTTRTGMLYRMTYRLGVERTLDPVARETYLYPYAAGDEPGPDDWRERRRVVLDGPGPATILDGDLDAPTPQHPDHVAGVLNRTAAALARMDDVPFLLVYAEPGLITNEPALAWAREQFERLSVQTVRAGHFMPEDDPQAVADAILAWYRAEVLR